MPTDIGKLDVTKIKSTEDFYSGILNGLESAGDELDPNYDDDSKDKDEIDLNSVGQNKDELDKNFKETVEAIKEGGDTKDFDENFDDESETGAITKNEEDESEDVKNDDYKWKNHPDMTGEVDSNAVDKKDFDANYEDETNGALDKNFEEDKSITGETFDQAKDPNEQFKKKVFEYAKYDPNENTKGLARLGESYDPSKDDLHTVTFRCNCGQEINEKSYAQHVATEHKGDSWFVGEAATGDKNLDKIVDSEEFDDSDLEFKKVESDENEEEYEDAEEVEETCGICYGDHKTEDHAKSKESRERPIPASKADAGGRDDGPAKDGYVDEPNHEIGSHYLKSKKGSREAKDEYADEKNKRVSEFADSFPEKKDDPVDKVLKEVNGKGEDDIITEALKSFSILRQG